MKRFKGVFYIIATAFLFSSTEVAVKYTNGAFNGIQLNFLRFLLGGFILLPMAIKQLREWKYSLQLKDLLLFVWTGFLFIVVSMTLYILSINYVPASLAAILYSSNTFFSIVFAAILLDEKIQIPVRISLIVCFIGILILIIPHLSSGTPIGIIIGLGSAITFGLYAVLSKKATKNKPTQGNVLSCFSFIMGSLELAILMALSHLKPISDFMVRNHLQGFSKIPFFNGITLSNLPILLIISLLITGAGFAMYFLAIQTINVTMASLIFFLKPALSTVIAFIVLQEIPPKAQIIGLIFIIIGSSVIFRTNYQIMKDSSGGKI